MNLPTEGMHPLVVSANKKLNEGIDPKVQELLEELSTGITTEDKLAYEKELNAASKPEPVLGDNGKPLIGADGKPVTHMPEQPAPLEEKPMTGQDLINYRQVIRKLSEKFELGNVNSRILRGLITSHHGVVSPMDQALEQLAEESHVPGLVDTIRQARSTYAAKHDVFEENKIIQNLMDKKGDDAANGFIALTNEGVAKPGSSKVMKNIRDLRTVLGDDGLHAFGKMVFGTVLHDCTDANGMVNADKFFNTMSRFQEEPSNLLFDWGDVNNGLAALRKDAHSAAILQKLTRMGVLGSFGAVAGAMPRIGLGTLIGMVAGEGGGMGGIAKGRTLLDYVANHPRMWGIYRTAGKIATSPITEKVGMAGRYGAAGAYKETTGNPTTYNYITGQGPTESEPPEPSQSLKDALGGVGASLGGNQ